MKAMELRRFQEVLDSPLVPVERPRPRPGPGEVGIKVEACAVCRTDLQIVEGELPAKGLPLVPGHQVVGRVVECGAGVDPGMLDRRVGVGWLAGTCGRCHFCRGGQENLCPQAEFTGWDRDGGYAEELVARADFCFPIAEELDPGDAAPLLCGGIIGYRALRLTELSEGGRLGLFGFGASALLVAQLANHFGFEVYAVSRDQQARRRALEFGAVWAGRPGEPLPVPLQAAITFAPVGEVVTQALAALDRGGVCVVNAIHLDRVPEFPYQLLYWERKLLSVANFTREDSSELLRLAAEIPIRTRVESFSLGQANQALLRLKRDGLEGAAVLRPG